MQSLSWVRKGRDSECWAGPMQVAQINEADPGREYSAWTSAHTGLCLPRRSEERLVVS